MPFSFSSELRGMKVCYLGRIFIQVLRVMLEMLGLPDTSF